MAQQIGLLKVQEEELKRKPKQIARSGEIPGKRWIPRSILQITTSLMVHLDHNGITYLKNGLWLMKELLNTIHIYLIVKQKCQSLT